MYIHTQTHTYITRVLPSAFPRLSSASPRRPSAPPRRPCTPQARRARAACPQQNGPSAAGSPQRNGSCAAGTARRFVNQNSSEPFTHTHTHINTRAPRPADMALRRTPGSLLNARSRAVFARQTANSSKCNCTSPCSVAMCTAPSGRPP